MRPRKGSSLLIAMLLSTLLLVMVSTSLRVRGRAYDEARIERDSVQARLLAEAGVQDALTKLSKDARFPPRADASGPDPSKINRNIFSYAEEVYHPVTGVKIGSYVVGVDITNRDGDPDLLRTASKAYNYPNFTVVITSWGYVYAADGRPAARRRIMAELDTSPKRRGAEPKDPLDNPALAGYYTNPNLFRMLRWEDSGSI